jgi:hypothetical protein
MRIIASVGDKAGKVNQSPITLYTEKDYIHFNSQSNNRMCRYSTSDRRTGNDSVHGYTRPHAS